MTKITAIRCIDDIDRKYGTKAQGLKVLYDNCLNTPVFFSISSQALDDYRMQNGIDTVMEFFMNSRYDEDYLIEFDKIPSPVIDLSLFEDGCYIVRSSSVANGDIDKRDFSSIISGAFESFIANNKSDISLCIKKVWRSAFEKKAFYQCKLFSEKSIIAGLGIVIQKMIKPVFSGVAHVFDQNVQVSWVEGHLSKIVKDETRGREVTLYKTKEDHYIIRGKEEAVQTMTKDNNRISAFCNLLDSLLQIRILMNDNLEIEWLYDGEKIWFVQAQELLE